MFLSAIDELYFIRKYIKLEKVKTKRKIMTFTKYDIILM